MSTEGIADALETAPDNGRDGRVIETTAPHYIAIMRADALTLDSMTA